MKLEIDSFIPHNSITCVVFGFDKKELKILVLKWKDSDIWTLPVGFIKKHVSLDEAAIRILQNRTGLKLPFLEQFYTFGSTERRNLNSNILSKSNFKDISSEFAEWIDKRFIGTGYLSLVNIDKCEVSADEISDKCEWVSINNLPKLLYDHSEMVSKALRKIRMELNYLPIGISMLEEKFTMKELQLLYQSILGKELDRGNFQKKMLKLGILIRLEKQNNGGAHKAPYLYKFDEIKYKSLLDKGFGYIN